MDFYSKYKAKVMAKGLDEQDRLIQNGINTFYKYVQGAPNKKTFTLYDCKTKELSKDTYEGTLQDSAFNDKKNTDEKILCTFNEVPIEAGSIVDIKGKKWIVVFEEHNTIPTHKTLTIRPCNNLIKWKALYKDKEVIYEIPCLSVSTTLYSLGIEETIKATFPEGRLTVVLPKNDVTLLIDRGFRFIFYNRLAYKVTNFDISEFGIMTLTLEETPMFVEKDDKVNNLAFNEQKDICIDHNFDNTNVTTSTTIEIIGLEGIKINKDYTYSVKIMQNNIDITNTVKIDWSMVDMQGNAIPTTVAKISQDVNNSSVCTIMGTKPCKVKIHAVSTLLNLSIDKTIDIKKYSF